MLRMNNMNHRKLPAVIVTKSEEEKPTLARAKDIIDIALNGYKKNQYGTPAVGENNDDNQDPTDQHAPNP